MWNKQGEKYLEEEQTPAKNPMANQNAQRWFSKWGEHRKTRNQTYNEDITVFCMSACVNRQEVLNHYKQLFSSKQNVSINSQLHAASENRTNTVNLDITTTHKEKIKLIQY